MVKYILGFLLFWTSGALGQTFYVGTNIGQLKRVTISGNSATYQDIAMCPDLSMGSLAIHKNVLYTANGFIQYQATISGNMLINCSPISNIPLSNALTVDNQGALYTVNGFELYKTDVNGMTSLIGTMPYTSAGDLAFFGGTLYMASPVGIVEINLSDTQASKLIIPSDLIIFGITTSAYSSTQNKLFALAVNNNVTSIYEVNLNDKTLGNVIATLPFETYDAASDAEDGALQPIKIRTIQAVSDCPYTGKGTVQIICENALVDYTYTLNGVTNSTGIFTNIPAGNYSASVQSPSETVNTTAAINYTISKPILNVSQTNPVCNQKGEITIAAAADGNLYQIQYAGNLYNFDHTFTDLTAGNYHFSILNKNGCQVDEVNLSLTQPVCPITVSQILVNEECDVLGKGRVLIVTEATGDIYTYTLGAIVNNTGVFVNVEPGAHNINISSSNGQVKNIPVVVPDYDAIRPTLSIVSINPLCDVLGTVSFALPVADFASYSVKYQNSTFPLNHVFAGLSVGSYQFTILKPDGCVFATKQVTLVKSQCTIKYNSVGVTEECDIPGKGKININTLPHGDVYSYMLDAGVVSNNTGVFNNISPGDHLIKITNADDEKIVNITVPDYNALKPDVQFVIKNLLCDASGSIQLTIPNVNISGYKIRFNTNLYNFDHVFTMTSTGSYHFEIIKPDGCILKVVDVPIGRSKCEIELLTPTVVQECDVAFKGSIQVNSNPHAYTYTYKLDNGVSNTTGLFHNLDPGNYNIIVSSIEDTEQVSVTIPDYRSLSPVVTITKIDAECELQGSVKFNLAANSEGYKIRLDAFVYPFDHEFKLNEGGHDFTVLKPNGCILDTYHVEMAKLPCDLMKLPTAFSPNNDGINDDFKPNQGSDAENYNLKIYSRLGMLLFTSNTLFDGWRGEYNGRPVAAGVYYWVLSYTNNTGKNLKKSGYVTLIR